VVKVAGTIVDDSVRDVERLLLADIGPMARKAAPPGSLPPVTSNSIQKKSVKICIHGSPLFQVDTQ
jgi:regulator of RNase E activity RraA